MPAKNDCRSTYNAFIHLRCLNIYIYIHTYIHACMHTCLHTYVTHHTCMHTYIHTKCFITVSPSLHAIGVPEAKSNISYIRTFMHTYIHTYIQNVALPYRHHYMRLECLKQEVPAILMSAHICVFVCAYVCTHLRICVMHLSACILRICVCVCLYLHTHTHTCDSNVCTR